MAEHLDELLVSLSLQSDKKSFQDGMSMFNGLRQAALSLGGVIATGLGTRQIAQFAGELDKLGRTADRLNVGVGGIHQLGHAYKMVGANASDAVSDLERLRAIQDDVLTNPSGDAFATLASMGVNPEGIALASSTEEAFNLLIERASTLGADQRRIALGSLGLSQGAVSLADEGPEAMREYMSFAARNAELTQDVVDQARDFNQELVKLGETGRDIYQVLAVDVVGTLKPMLEAINKWVGEDGNFELAKDLVTGGPLKATEGPVDSWLRENGLGWMARDIGEFIPFLSGDDEPPQASIESMSRSDLRRMVAQAEQDIGAPPGLLWAQIGQESSYNPRAVSKAGARGLAQIMPATERSLEARFGRDLDPFNPVDAIAMQKELMREAYQASGDWDTALRMYHGGWDRSAWGDINEAYAPSIRSRMNNPQASTTNHNTFNITGSDPQAIASAVDERLRHHSEIAAQDYRTGIS